MDDNNFKDIDQKAKTKKMIKLIILVVLWVTNPVLMFIASLWANVIKKFWVPQIKKFYNL